MSDRISIAMTTYNGEKYIREQLDSLYSQTRIPDEVIVCDDLSSDGTVKILEEYHKKYGLKYFINDKNLGVNKNFEKSVSFCSGDYIAFCDQDDIWLPQKIEKSYIELKRIEKNGLPSLVKVMQIEIDKHGNKIRVQKSKDNNNYIYFLIDFYVLGCTMMFNKKLLKYILPFPDEKEAYFDIYSMLTAAMTGNVSNISEHLMYYRRHDSNVFGKYKGNSLLIKFLKYFIKWDRVKYFPFFYNRRAKIMSNILKIQSNIFIEDRKNIYINIYKIGEESDIFKKIILVFKIKEFNFIQKINAIINILINLIFPIFGIKYKNTSKKPVN